MFQVSVLLQIFAVPSLRDFQRNAASETRAASSRVFLNVSTGGGKTLALLWPVVCDALEAATSKQYSLSLCFVPLLALQSNLVERLRKTEQLQTVLHVLSLSVAADGDTLDSLLGSKAVWSKSVVAFLNPERFAKIKSRLLEDGAPRITTFLFDEAHTYVEWDSFRPAFDSFAGLARDFPKARFVAATATLTTAQLESFSSEIGFEAESWRMVIKILSRLNHVYHIVEERVLLRHVSGLFSEERLPCLVVVNSLASLVALHARIVEWSRLPASSVLLFAAGFSKEHQRAADASFRDPLDRKKIMIATSAYSLGIDAFIRSVVHYGVPRDVASYFQGVGRAGRDPTIFEAHCTLVVDTAGLQAASKEMRQLLGSARQRSKKPSGSTSMAQCSVCLSWRHLGKDVAVPKEDEVWTCEQGGVVCSNVSRLPCCVNVMAMRFLRRESGQLDGPLKDTETKCNRCDWCVSPKILEVPAVASFVRVISSTHGLFNHVGQVTAVSDDSVKLTVNFGGILCAEHLPYDVVCVCSNVVLPMAMQAPEETAGPQVLKKLLLRMVDSRNWGIPTAAVITETGISSLVKWRPSTPENVRAVCGDEIDESAVLSVANVISTHQQAKNKKKKKRRGKKAGKDREGDEEEAQSVDDIELRSKRSRKPKKINKR